MATLLPPGKRQFFSASGDPLSGGTVAYFVPGTSTPQNTWQDSGQSILNANPITLDSAGEAIIFGSGNYRELVKDSLGNTIWDQTVTQLAGAIDSQNGVYLWGGTSTGAANTYAITLNPPVLAYVAGQTFRFLTHQANTGAATLNVNAQGAKSITKNGATALISGDIANGAVIEVCYDGTQFELQTTAGSLALTAGTGLQATGAVISTDPSFWRGYLGGLTLSNDVTTPATKLDIAAGICVSDDNTTQMKLASAYIKTTGAWAVGSGNGALDTGSVASNTWYAVFIIERTDTGVVDVIFTKETAGTAPSPVMPSGYTKKRYIGSFETDVSASILAFTQVGDEFIFAAAVGDVNVSNLSTTATPFTLSVPLGIQVDALFRATASNASAYVVLVSSPDENAVAANSPTGNATHRAAAGVTTVSQLNLRTNTSGQVRAVSTLSGTTLQIATYGWVDIRGRFA